MDLPLDEEVQGYVGQEEEMFYKAGGGAAQSTELSQSMSFQAYFELFLLWMMSINDGFECQEVCHGEPEEEEEEDEE